MVGSQGILEHFIGRFGGSYYYSYNRLTGVTVERGLTFIVSASSADLTLTNSQIAYSARSGIAGNSSSLIVGNMILGNTNYGVSGSGVNARHNWWGDISGPYHATLNPGGAGDRVGESVIFDPWIGKQTQQSGDLIDTALPDDLLRNTAEMEPGVPYIKSVRSASNFFLFSVNQNTERLTVNMDWNGSDPGTGEPGTVHFKLKSTTYTANGNASGVVYDLPLEHLKAGVNELQIIATNAGGVLSEPYVVRISRFLAPKWMTELGFNGNKVKVTVRPEYTEMQLTLSFPPRPFDVNLGSAAGVPFLNQQKKPKTPRIEAEFGMRSDNVGSVKISGEFPFSFAGSEASFTPSGKGNLYFDEQGLLGVDKGKFEAKGKVKIKLPKVSLVRVVAQGIPLDYIADLYLQTTVEPSLSISKGFTYAPTATTTTWLPGGNLGGDLKLTLELVGEILKGLAKVSGYGGGSAGFTLQTPPDPEYLQELRGSVFWGLKYEALGFIKGTAWEETWEYSYRPGDTRQSMVSLMTLTDLDTTQLTHQEVHTEDWQVARRDYDAQPYAAFLGGAATPRAVLHSPHAPLGTTVQPLVTNLYVHAEPALVLRDQHALLVWVHDDITLPESQSKGLVSSWWNGSAWSTPVSVTHNTMSEFSPQVVLLDDTRALALWERINDPAVPLTATLDMTLTNKVELVYALFDFDTQTWTEPALLTANEVFDHVPQLASNGAGQAAVVWRSNAAGELIGDAMHPDALNYALWDNDAWSAPGVISDTMTDLLAYSVALSDTSEAVVVMSRDRDGDQATHADIELFAVTWDGAAWSDFTQLTDNAVSDDNPTVLYTASGERRLIWVQDERLAVLHDDWTEAPTLTSIEGSDLGLMNFVVAVDAQDNLMLIWRDYTDAGQDLFYALYDETAGLWSLESQLTDDPALERDFAAAFDPNGQLMVAYALDHLTETVKIISPTLIITGVTEYDYTDLYVLHYTPETDLTVSDLSLPRYFENPWPGDSVDVAITVQNAGAWGVLSPTVALYDGDPALDGTLVATRTIAGPLAGGASADVTIRWTVPVTPVQPHTLYAVVDPDNEIDESNEANNDLTLTTVTPDVAIASVKTYYYDQHNVVPLAVIANNGPVTATNVLVEFRAEAITGTVQHTAVITELAPQGLVAITTTWNVAGWDAGEYTYYAVVDSEDTIYEVNEEDNWDYFPVKVLPDLVIYSGDVQAALTESGGPVTVTVRNWGTADAADVPVVLYEGSVITTSATALYTWTVASLPVDSDGDVQLVTTLDHRPNRLFAIADPQQTLAEISRHNNIALLNQPISLTFRYHDLESLIPPTATVTLVGDWASAPYTLTGAGGMHSVTISTAETPLNYRYAVDGNLALLNTYTRTVTPTVAIIYDDYRAVTPDEAQLIGPASLEGAVGAPTAPITAHITLADVTALPGTTFIAEVGYGTSAALAEWTWTPIVYTGVVGNADQFVGDLTPLASGVYSYTVRFNGNWGIGNPHSAWLYADLDGWANGFDLGQVGVLTVP